MKKLMIVLMCMMLCGCSNQSNENTNITTTTTTPVTTTTSSVTTTTKVTTSATTTTKRPETVATTTVPTTIVTTTKVTTTTPITTTTARPVVSGLIEMTSGDIMNMIFNQESFIVYLGTSYCPHCVEYKPHVEEFLKDYKDVAIYYVVLDKSDAAQTSELTSLVALEYTPTTFL
ncbi:MAG: hypothetical protein IKM20_05285, partial [Erysipelotrichales bacterium]|nr:hypothetical protein [Erysipelotrichales bacterium]